MKLNSLIETIKGSIATETPSDVKIVERSLLFDLFKKRRDRDQNPRTGGADETDADPGDGKDDERPFAAVRLSRPGRIWSQQEGRYPFCSMIGRALLEGLLFVVDLFYWICSKAMSLFLGRKRWLYRSPRFNFVILAASAVGSISLLVSIFAFYINDVLFFNNVTTINRCGALVTRQACGVDHYMYLFNTANLWSDTGIEVLRGDRVRISGSGAFYSDILDMKQAAKDNRRLLYPLSNVAYPLTDRQNSDRKETRDAGLWHNGRKEEARGAAYCMYSDPEDAVYGSLLYQIIGETQRPQPQGDRTNLIHQVRINRKGRLDDNFFEARESGVLHVAVNDIFLDPVTIARIKEDKDTADFAKARVRQRLLKLEHMRDSLDGLSRAGHRPVDHRWFAESWFNDNCGDILLNVTIERQNGYNPYTSLMDRGYICLYRLLSWFIDIQTGWIPSHPHASFFAFWALAVAVVYVLVRIIRFVDGRYGRRAVAVTARVAGCARRIAKGTLLMIAQSPCVVWLKRRMARVGR